MATQFIHVNPGSLDAFALAFVDSGSWGSAAGKLGVSENDLDNGRRIIEETNGDVIVMFGEGLSAAAQAALAGFAANLNSESRRALLHPLAKYNNSVGANDIVTPRRSLDDVLTNSKALFIAGSLPDASILAGKGFVVVQELFETETTAHADVVFPAASFAEVDGTFTNNAGNVQRVRKAIDPLHQSKPDWMITSLIAREMGSDLGLEFSASGVFKALADALPAYADLRYPALKDESNPARANYEISGRDISGAVTSLRDSVASLEVNSVKDDTVPRIGHKLHRLTTMTSKTPQFHLLANGNPKPENLLVSPLVQFDENGNKRSENADAAAVGIADRSVVGK
jgi:NADH dehydrogenase/NADH:ubiquinone oxidoreductase subunit G